MKMPSAQGTLQDLAKPLNVRYCSYCLAANRGAYAGLPSILPAPANTFTTRIKTQTNQQLSPQPKSTTPPKPPFLKIANWILVGLPASAPSLFAFCWQTSSHLDNQVHRHMRYSRRLMFPRLFAASGLHCPALDGGTARLVL